MVGLSQFGITDKEALKRAMIELGMIEGESTKNDNFILEVSCT
jgi:hypothetical protein